MFVSIGRCCSVKWYQSFIYERRMWWLFHLLEVCLFRTIFLQPTGEWAGFLLRIRWKGASRIVTAIEMMPFVRPVPGKPDQRRGGSAHRGIFLIYPPDWVDFCDRLVRLSFVIAGKCTETLISRASCFFLMNRWFDSVITPWCFRHHGVGFLYYQCW